MPKCPDCGADRDKKGLCWKCTREARRKAEGFRPRPNRKQTDPGMARRGETNAWTKMTAEAVAWLKIVGATQREEGTPWKDLQLSIAERYGIDVTLSNLMNILAGRSWAWMDDPEEYADTETRKQIAGAS